MADLIHRTSPELAALTPEVWSSAFHPTLLESLPMASVIAKDYEGDIRALGDQVNISTFPQFSAATEVAEGADNDADAVTASAITLVINKNTVKDYIITNVAQVQSIEAANALRDLVFHAIMKRMQALIFTATVPAGPNALTYTTATTLALVDILAAKEKLDENNVPDDGSRCMVLDAPQWNDIFNISGLTSRDFIQEGQSPLQNGSLPAQVLGFNPKLTTEANAVSYFFHPKYMEMAVQRGMDVRVFDKGVEGIRAERVNSSVLWGLVQASNVRVVTVS